MEQPVGPVLRLAHAALVLSLVLLAACQSRSTTLPIAQRSASPGLTTVASPAPPESPPSGSPQSSNPTPATAPGAWLTAIQVVSTTELWGVQNAPYLYALVHSIDGGRHWTRIRTRPGTLLDFTARGRRIWVVLEDLKDAGMRTSSSPTHIRVDHSDDAGRTWVVGSVFQSTPALAAFRFTDDLHGWMVGEHGAGGAMSNPDFAVNVTSDAGVTWQVVWAYPPGAPDHPDPSPPPYPECLSVDSPSALGTLDAATAWVTATDRCARPLLYVTHDRGRNWTKQELGLPPAFSPASDEKYKVDGPEFDGATIGWMVGRGWRDDVESSNTSWLYATGDGGRSWSPRLLPANPTAYDFSDPSHLWFTSAGQSAPLGPAQSLYVSTDRGANWTRVGDALPVANARAAVRFIGAMGWALGGSGGGSAASPATLYLTRNGGVTWIDLTPQLPAAFDIRCAPSQLQLGWNGWVSEPTGQHSLSLVLVNTSLEGCYLWGYPGIALVDSSGHLLPFLYERSGDQVVTSAAPVRVDIGPQQGAFVTLNKYRCDAGDQRMASTVRLIPPDDYSAVQLPVPNGIDMAYCGAGDPGSIVHISPVEPYVDATLAGP